MYFDIGANVGRWSLANIKNCDRIIAVEASPTTFNNLIRNIKNEKIICLNFVVCNSKDEYITFYNCTADTLSTINKDWLDSEKSRFYNKYKYDIIRCPTISLDKLIEEYGIPELIKIDVEGGEFETISSLTRKVNCLCFEWASETKDIAIQCMEYLQKLGYTEFSIQYDDVYTYRPTSYTDLEKIKSLINKTTPKNEFGMIWAK